MHVGSSPEKAFVTGKKYPTVQLNSKPVSEN